MSCIDCKWLVSVGCEQPKNYCRLWEIIIEEAMEHICDDAEE